MDFGPVPDDSRWLLLGTAAVGLFFLSLFLLGAGCGESGNPESTGLCKSMPAGGPSWWAAVIGPSALLVASQLIPWFRRHALVPLICVILAGIVFWTYVLADASGNLG
jgi:hypothetical protein